MKEIKFRAWNHKRKEIYEVFSIAKDYVFKDTLDGIGSPGVPDEVEDVVIMQYTGFKDCEGNEIYEGDTLIDIDVELEPGVKIENTTQQVYWCNDHGAWKLDNTFSQDQSDGWTLGEELQDYRFKIYGNIYEK